MLKYVINRRDSYVRIARWVSILSEYDFEVVQKPGLRNPKADYLSRPVGLVKLVLTMEIES